MAEREMHAILSFYEGFGFGLTSPQFPGFAGGFDQSESPLNETVLALLRDAGAPSDFMLRLHVQRDFERKDRRWAVRVQEDWLPRLAEARRAAADHLMELLSQTPEPIDDARRDATGDPVFLVALESDTVGWVEDQLEDDDWVMVVVDTPGDLSVFPLGRVGNLPDGQATIPPSTTIGELMAGISFAEVHGVEFSAREAAVPVLV